MSMVITHFFFCCTCSQVFYCSNSIEMSLWQISFGTYFWWYWINFLNFCPEKTVMSAIWRHWISNVFVSSIQCYWVYYRMSLCLVYNVFVWATIFSSPSASKAVAFPSKDTQYPLDLAARFVYPEKPSPLQQLHRLKHTWQRQRTQSLTSTRKRSRKST